MGGGEQCFINGWEWSCLLKTIEQCYIEVKTGGNIVCFDSVIGLLGLNKYEHDVLGLVRWDGL